MRAMSSDGGPIPLHWVEDLFARLSGVLGDAMCNVYASADPQRVKAEWAEALAGFSSEEVRRGLTATRTRRFAPNLPEFLHLCRPSLDPEEAWIEAEHGMRAHNARQLFPWSHPAVYWAARDFVYELRAEAYTKCRKRWAAAMTAQWERGAWAAPPDPRALQLGASQQRSIDPLSAEEAIERTRVWREKLTGYRTRRDEESARIEALRSEEHEEPAQ